MIDQREHIIPHITVSEKKICQYEKVHTQLVKYTVFFLRRTASRGRKREGGRAQWMI